jgi:hypothetical protein
VPFALSHPTHVQLQRDGSPIPPFQQDVDGPLPTLAAKLEAMIVIAERESGGAALHSRIVHFVCELFVVLQVTALLRPDIGITIYSAPNFLASSIAWLQVAP